MNLDIIMQQQPIWRAGELDRQQQETIPTGYTVLDTLLAGQGLPMGALTEVLTDADGSSAMQLLIPALAKLSQQGRWLAMIAPPHLPYAPALAAAGVDISRVLLVHPDNDTAVLWAMEQSLRAGTCGAVLAWPKVVDERHTRRLQLAAEEGHALGLLFHASPPRAQTSPAALRLQLETCVDGMNVHILKRRGGWPVGPVHLDWKYESNLAMPLFTATPARRFHAS